jgi:purine-nucleoside/S-methyl-5'-thioadenosine phosphorylase / adenosine deaminase
MKMLNDSDLIFPDWPAPRNVRSLQTTRVGGASNGSYASLNLGDHVNDDPLKVAANRQLLNSYVPTEPLWLNQVHGIVAVDLSTASCLPAADASYASVSNAVCAVMTADCLPILLCDLKGTIVAAVHAGWRSLLDGVVEATVMAMHRPGSELMAWLGPAIGPDAFEVGDEVRAAFVARDSQAEAAFRSVSADKWLGDIYLLARLRLQKLGITQIYGDGTEAYSYCTYSDAKRFFSFRRDGATGRMATMIWMDTLNG